ncbi:MAG: EAL domain-containing protein [Gammaproteobacteria bacterium]|nr:EAL domain-containing protein [Gammaproteobacteria bacterium]MBQ0838443.1 EAL domain-containing protein [Gammaproteobacteria bacterium]
MQNETLSDAELGAVTFNAGQPSIIADVSGKIIKVNQAFLSLSGFPAEMLIGSTLNDYYAEQEDSGFLNFFQSQRRVEPPPAGAIESYTGKTLRDTWQGQHLELVETLSFTPGQENAVGLYLISCQEIGGLIPKIVVANESDKSFRQLIESLPEAAVVLDGLHIDACNEQFARLVQRDKSELAGLTSTDLSMPLQHDGVNAVEKLDRILSALERGRLGTIEWLLQLPNGEPREVEVSFSGFDYYDRRLTFASVRDITDRKRMEIERQALLDELAQKEEMTRLATRAGGIVIWEADIQSNTMSWSDGASDLFGLSANKLPNTLKELRQFVFEDDLALLDSIIEDINAGRPFELENRFQRSDGELRWLRTQGEVECDSNEQPFLVRAAVSDISEYKKAQQEISRLAYYDPLTKLANRRLLLDRLHQYCAAAKRNKTSGVVFYLDLDRFKLLNDSLGHASGDILLIEVARRLLDVFRTDDTVARIGGDEFVVVVPVINGGMHMVVHKARVIADKLRATLATDYIINGLNYHMSSSIGLAVFPEDGDTAESVIQNADVAMYQAKKNGRNAVAFYSAEQQQDADRRVLIEQDLRQAIKHQQFELYYQPKVDSEGQPVGVEALIRWRHPQRGLVSPADFIGIAEESGLIVDVGQWVLEAACAQLRAWQERYLLSGDFNISINISPVQFRRKDFVTNIEGVIQGNGVAPGSVMLEITEGMLIEDIDDTVEKLNLLKQLGVKISIDDFGTGYSSLYYLKRLPLDEIKIDKTYVHNITNDKDDAAIVKTIMDIARHFGLEPVAEGVENKEQAAFLSDIGCQVFQGFLYSKPLPAEEFSAQYF